MDVSVLIPTRGNTASLKELIDSLFANASNNNSWEALIAYDKDDIKTKQFLESLTYDNIFYFEFERKGYPRLHEYFNSLCEKARGRWLWSLADDVEIIKNNWNEIFLETNFYLLHIDFNNHPSVLPLCPAIPKKWYEIQGHFSLNAQSDCWLGNIANNLKIINKISEPYISLKKLSNGSQHQIHSYTTECVPFWQEDLKKIANYLNITEYNLEKDPFS